MTPLQLIEPPRQGIVIDLKELEALMREFVDLYSIDPDRLEKQLLFSTFLAWLEKRQREETNGHQS